MPTPDDSNEAYALVRDLRDAGVELTINVTPNCVYVHATDTDGQVYQHTRDDGDLLAAVREVA